MKRSVAEVLLAEAIKTGAAKVVTDARRSYEFDRERAVDFGQVPAGQQLGEFVLQVDTETVYNLHLHSAQEAGGAELTLKQAGRLLPIKSRTQPEVPTARSYEFSAKYTRSWDYANIQAFVDGQPLGPVVDTYAATVVPGETTMLGMLALTAGRHVVRFQAVGKNPQSKGFLMGIDHVTVK